MSTDRTDARARTASTPRAPPRPDSARLLDELRVVLRKKKSLETELLELKDREGTLLHALDDLGVSSREIADAVSSIEGVHAPHVAGRLRKRKSRARARLLRKRVREEWTDEGVRRDC